MLSSTLQVLTLLLKQVKVKRAVIYHVLQGKCAVSLPGDNVVLYDWRKYDDLHTISSCTPHNWPFTAPRVVFGVTLQPWGHCFATRVEHTNLCWDSHSQLSCLHLSQHLACCAPLSDKQTGSADSNSNFCQIITALRCMECENARINLTLTLVFAV